MIYSDKRKLSLCGWLKKYDKTSYEAPLKLQKFLFFYEALTKLSGENPNFNGLKGYKNGPVFSSVWGDYTKERDLFNVEAERAYLNNPNINENRAKKSSFFVKIMTEEELSDFTHQLNIWRAEEQRIVKGEKQVELKEENFGSEDEKLMREIDAMFPLELIDNSEVLTIEGKNFVLSNSDFRNITEGQQHVLETLAKKEELHNPVFVEIEDDGRLLVD